MELLALSFQIYTAWLTIFSISFTFLPIFIVLDWRKRGTADGFSSVNFVLPLLTMAFWFKHGVLTDDFVNKFINGVCFVFFSFYIAAFWWYQPKRKYLYGQLAGLVAVVALTISYVHTHPEKYQADLMGSIAAGGQIFSLFGGVYEVKRAISLGTTEYIPASMQFGIFALTVQWSLFAVLVQNQYMLVANLAGLALNIITLSLYFVYPPKTWRVPIFNVGGAEQEAEKAKKTS